MATPTTADLRQALLGLPEKELAALLAEMATANRTQSASSRPIANSPIRSPSFVSSASQTTSTPSTSAPLGLGSLSGKAIFAVGTWELYIAEWVTIQRKLSSHSQRFPHDDGVSWSNIEQIYGEILELTRADMYHTRVRRQALRLVMMQIACMQTRHLIQCVLKWPQHEIKLFMTVILSSMSESWLKFSGHYREDMHRDTWDNVYLPHIEDRYNYTLPAFPLITFCCLLAQGSADARYAVLEAGFLDVLLTLCLRKFSLIFLIDNESRDKSLEVYTATVRVIMGDTKASGIYLMHPIRVLWPETQVGKHRFRARRAAWELFPNPSNVVGMRLSGINDAMCFLDSNPFTETTAIIDACIDLLEFSTSETMESKLSTRALDILTYWMGRLPNKMSKILAICVHHASDPAAITAVISNLTSRVEADKYRLFDVDIFGRKPKMTRGEVFVRCFSLACECNGGYIPELSPSIDRSLDIGRGRNFGASTPLPSIFLPFHQFHEPQLSQTLSSSAPTQSEDDSRTEKTPQGPLREQWNGETFADIVTQVDISECLTGNPVVPACGEDHSYSQVEVQHSMTSNAPYNLAPTQPHSDPVPQLPGLRRRNANHGWKLPAQPRTYVYK